MYAQVIVTLLLDHAAADMQSVWVCTTVILPVFISWTVLRVPRLTEFSHRWIAGKVLLPASAALVLVSG